MLVSSFFFGGIIFLASLPSGVDCEALNLNNFDRCVQRTDGFVCYSAVDTPDLWDVGERVCNARNMTMLEILTEKENNEVLALLTRKGMVDAWLAAVQSTESWRWLDGVEIGDQGCFNDDETKPDIEYAEDFPTNNSVTNCIAYCRSLLYGYASVEAGSRCRCGDTFGRYGQENANCGIQCPGNHSESCGGNLPTSQQIYAVNGATANWLGGQPNNNNGYQSCVTLDSGSGYKWQDVFCKDGNKAICEIPMVNGRCVNAQASVVNGRCLMLTSQEVSYFQSRYNCRSLGGDMVLYLTAADTQEIARWPSLQTGRSVQLYIGLVKWQWKWQTGSEFLYTNWKNDQPTGPNFNCITIKRDSSPGEWTAASCNSSHLYICQTSNATVKVTAPLFTLAPTTAARRTAPPPLPTTPRGSSSLSTFDQGQPPSPGPTSSNSTVNVRAAIIGGAVAGGVFLLIVICVVVIAIACCGATCCCCSRRGADAKEKGVESGSETASAPPPPSYFFGIETTPKYRNGDKSSTHPAIPDFDTIRSDSSSAVDRNQKSPNPDVVPRAASGSYPMATPYEDAMETTRRQPDPYSSDVYVKPELSY